MMNNQLGALVLAFMFIGFWFVGTVNTGGGYYGSPYNRGIYYNNFNYNRWYSYHAPMVAPYAYSNMVRPYYGYGYGYRGGYYGW